MKSTAILLSAFLILTASAFAQADTLAYVRSSSQLKSKKRAAYHPINLLDNDPNTIWCEGAEGRGEGELIHIYFKRPQAIDRVIVSPTMKSGRNIRKLAISDGSSTLRITLAGDVVDQDLEQSLSGTEYTIVLEDVGQPNKSSKLGSDVACLSDVVFFYKDRPFGGRSPLSALRYDERKDQILGYWSGGVLGAPEKFITFAIDGTWRFEYKPLMTGKPKKVSGEYRFRGNRLLMRQGETGRWADVRLNYKAVKVGEDNFDGPLRDYEILSFKPPFNKLIGDNYNNAQF